jgi:hypothetical protein
VKIQKEKFFDFLKAENSCWPAVMFNLRLELHETEENGLLLKIKSYVSCVVGRVNKMTITAHE